jgi:hypothetical protein
MTSRQMRLNENFTLFMIFFEKRNQSFLETLFEINFCIHYPLRNVRLTSIAELIACQTKNLLGNFCLGLNLCSSDSQHLFIA